MQQIFKWGTIVKNDEIIKWFANFYEIQFFAIPLLSFIV